MTDQPATDTPAAVAAAFATRIRQALPADVQADHDPVGGYAWRWPTTAGVWTLTAGSILDPRPIVTGPAGQWRLDGNTLHHADLVVLMLRLAGALPGGPSAAAVAAGTVYGGGIISIGQAARRAEAVVAGIERRAVPAEFVTGVGYVPDGDVRYATGGPVAGDGHVPADGCSYPVAGSDLPPRGAGVSEPADTPQPAAASYGGASDPGSGCE